MTPKDGAVADRYLDPTLYALTLNPNP